MHGVASSGQARHAAASGRMAPPSSASRSGRMNPNPVEARSGRIPAAAAADASFAAPSGDFSMSPVSGAAAFDQEAPKRSGARVALIVLGVIAALLLIVYIAGVVVFSGRFYPNTVMGALDVSMKPFSEASSMVAEAERDYELTVSGQGLDLVVSSAQGGMSVDSNAVVDSAKSDMNVWLWPAQVFGEHDATGHLAATADASALGDVVRAAVQAFNDTATPSANAQVVFDADSGDYIVQKETYGDQLSEADVLSEVTGAIATMDSTLQLSDAAVAKPTVLSTDERLIEGAKQANSMAACDVELVASGTGTLITAVNSADISQWITFDENYDPVLDEAALSAWAQGLVGSLNTVGSERTYTRPDGKVVTVSGGTYGWAVDTATLEQTVKDAVANASTGTIEVACSQTGNGYTAPGQDWGAYCDVDLSEQYARYYDAAGNVLWESGIVSGLPDGENDTPTGVYSLNNHQRNVSLKGPVDPETKKPKWDSPVSYWMPFVGNLVGLHDAPWQSASVFSDPSAYHWAGSHGCVNLPVDKAAQIYDIIQDGDPVIVHW